MPRVVRRAPTPDAEPQAKLELNAELPEAAAVPLTALGTAASVRARWNTLVPNKVVLLGGGILVQGDEAGGEETLGEAAAVLDMAASRLGRSRGAAIPSLVASLSGDNGS